MKIELESGLSAQTIQQIRDHCDRFFRLDPNLNGLELRIEENCDDTSMRDLDKLHSGARLYAQIKRIIQQGSPA